MMKRNVDVTVFACRADDSDEIVFSYGVKCPPGVKNKKDVLDFDPETGEFEIVYRLKDHSGRQLRFKGDVGDAIWIQPGQQCPSGASAQSHAFSGLSVRNNGKELVASNSVGACGETFCYSLRFEDGDGRTHEFDPYIRNSGGGGT